MTITAECNSGKLQGETIKGVHRFLGIPFAQAPVGELRWRKPKPVEPWTGARDATAYGDSAPQEKNPIMRAGKQNEDCLYLNVWTPNLEANLPVMIWIHGGAFLVGSGAQREYSGRRLASSGEVVVVNINYRLGALGFAAFDANPEDFDLNVGIHDQIAALQWVQDNISAFGGDPGNVTIFGESAGGMSVSTLLATQAAGKLFHKAIAQSGATHHYISQSEAHKVSDKLADVIGVDPYHPHKIRKVAAKDLVRAQRRTAGIPVHAGPWRLPMQGMNFIPVIDEDLLPQGVHPAIESGNAKGIPLMTGTTAEEFRLFSFIFDIAPDPKKAKTREISSRERLLNTLENRAPGYGDYLLEQYQQLHPKAKPAKIDEMVETDRVFTVPADRLAKAQAQHAPVYLYRFDWESPMFGAAHATDIPFVFGCTDNQFGKMFTGGSPEARTLSEKVQAAWIQFAKTGSPGHAGLPDWPQFDPLNRPAMVFNKTCSLGSNLYAERIAVWERF